ncbi:Rv3654c family TadE-like protein [Actinomadura sp. NPDC000929]|uniref:Rv3654c family TadE-like protein n=1 Tax=Actinomadura sp. NPDC000929 TaxID=3154517 RepID=UPI003396C334
MAREGWSGRGSPGRAEEEGSGAGSGVTGGGGEGVGRRVKVRGGDRGSGTVWVLGFAVLVWVVGVAAVLVGGVRGARHGGEAAADMAALAGAARVVDGGRSACARARQIASGSGARMVRCRVRGETVDVSVAVEVPMLMGLKGRRIVSRARAGPVERDGVPWRHMSRCTECQ